MKELGILYKKRKRYFHKLFFKHFKLNFRKIKWVPPLATYTSSCLIEIWLIMTHAYTHTHPVIPTLDCLVKHTFLIHAYGGAFLARMQRHAQFAYLVLQCVTSLFSWDSHIVECIVRYTGVERPFSSSCICLQHSQIARKKIGSIF